MKKMEFTCLFFIPKKLLTKLDTFQNSVARVCEIVDQKKKSIKIKNLM